MKQLTAPIMQNPVGALVGGVAFYWASHKYAGVTNMNMRIVLGLVGLYAGAYAQKQFSAMSSTPSATTTTSPMPK